jgi:hypothetical protein
MFRSDDRVSVPSACSTKTGSYTPITSPQIGQRVARIAQRR